MGIERIREAFSKDSASRFYILYGKGIDDAFISFNNREITLEDALNRYLKRRGYERIVYIAPHKPIYYLDEGSRLAADFHPIPETSDEVLPANEMQVLEGGPLGNAFLVNTRTTEPHPWLSENPQGDVHALRDLDVMMKEGGNPLTAVVIVQAEAFLSYFDDPRILAGILGSWFHLPAHNANICLCLFSCDRYETLRETAERLPVPEIRNMICRSQPEDDVNLIEIPGPDKAELVRLIRYGSAYLGLHVVDSEIEALAAWMAEEGLTARQWLARFSDAPSLDVNTARKLCWFSADRGEWRSIEDRLNQLVGLEPIKERIYELAAWLSVQKEKKDNPAARDSAPMLHMVFTGNPGTGKTTIARLIGQIFHDLGLLKKGHLVEVKSSDLIADHVGGTGIKTNDAITRALNGVLFIDEAYSLTEPERGGYGSEAVDILLKRMDDERSSLVVIVAGYPEKMQRFLQSNPGLTRRFPKENHFEFQDYSPDELLKILERMLLTRDLSYADELVSPLKEIIAGMHACRDDHFGNAGEMRNLAEGLERRRAYRIVKQSLRSDALLTIADIPEKYQPFLAPKTVNTDTVLGELDGLVGIEPVKEFIRSLANRLALDQARTRNRPSSDSQPAFQHLVFTGSPGTGKTTVARLLGRVYQSLGVLRRGHCVEVTRADLVAGYVGQTALKTREKIKEAMDGILFIDEAYALDRGGPGDYGREVIDTLIKAMEDYRSRLIVIVAGYPQEMDLFVSANPGLKSRLAAVVRFPDFDTSDLVKIFRKRAEQEGFTCSEEVFCKVQSYLEALRQADGFMFGNGRAVNTLFDQMKGRLAERVSSILSGGLLTEKENHLLSCFVEDDVPDPAVLQAAANGEAGEAPATLYRQFEDFARIQRQIAESSADYQADGENKPPNPPHNQTIRYRGRGSKTNMPY